MMYLKKRNSDDITYFTYIGEKEREREREGEENWRHTKEKEKRDK